MTTSSTFQSLDSTPSLKKATFAAGCFWCTESAFQEMPGVEDAFVGYVGGTTENPTYLKVVNHETDYKEGLRIYYNEDQVSFKDLLDKLWQIIDPTDAGGQYVDRGDNYSTVIYYHDEDQKIQAEESKKALEESKKFDKPIVTEILPYKSFVLAEEDHQDFYKKSAFRYMLYKKGSGRNYEE